MKSLCIGVVLILCVVMSQAQIGNYLLEAYNSAMEVKATYEEEVAFFRERLTWQADDFGYYFTSRIRNALNENTTPAQGAALQQCAATAAVQSQESINRFKESLLSLQEDANKLQSSVYEQLMETNIKEEDLELFYYYHNYRLDAARDRLFEVHINDLGNRWMEMWFEYFTISEAMDECIAVALE